MRISKYHFSFLIMVLVSLVSAASVSGLFQPEIKRETFPSTVFARNILSDTMTGDFEKAWNTLPDVYVDRVNERIINFFTEKSRGEIKFCFSLDSAPDFTNVKKGSCIVTRKRASGFDGISEIRFFIKNDRNSYVSITPSGGGEESLMKIRLYGYLMQQDIKVPLPVEKLAAVSFEEIEDLTSAYVNWGFYDPDPDYIYSDDVIRLSRRILPLLKFLQDADDGAMDKNGHYVYISSLKEQEGTSGLNCSGFVKWIIDGMYYPEKGVYTDISELKKKHMDLRGSGWSGKLEKEYDPFFGLDWTRNLAYAMAGLTDPGASFKSVDVKGLYYHSYVDNVGYPLKDLKTVAYELAVSSPDYFYLGSVNMITDDPPGLRKHLHVIAVFPYIDSSGIFHNIILSRNRRVTQAELEKAYPDAFVHLVKIKAGTEFDPPGMKFDPTIRRF